MKTNRPQTSNKLTLTKQTVVSIRTGLRAGAKVGPGGPVDPFKSIINVCNSGCIAPCTDGGF
jgi:hypothetical protein